MDNLTYIAIGIGVTIIVFVVVLMIKNEVTYRNLNLVSDAIFYYNLDMIRNDRYDAMIDLEHIRSYDETLFRLWDWGYKHIVPPEIFEVIKPYINK